MRDTPDALAPLTQAYDPPRLQLKPGVPTTAFVDGGWWPESRNLTAELPALLIALTPTIGRVALVGYHRAGWDAAPDHVDTGDERVLLRGWTADVPHSVVVIADSGQCVTLLVVSPESPESAAQHALSAASAPTPALDAEPGHLVDPSMTGTVDRISTLEGASASADRDRIARWVDEAAQQFVGAPIQGFVPILVEHIVRSRSQALRI